MEKKLFISTGCNNCVFSSGGHCVLFEELHKDEKPIELAEYIKFGFYHPYCPLKNFDLEIRSHDYDKQ